MEKRFLHSVTCSFRSTIRRICDDPILRREILGLMIYASTVGHQVIIDKFEKLCEYLLHPNCGSKEPMLTVQLWLNYSYKELYNFKEVLYSSPVLSAEKYAKASDVLNKTCNFLKDSFSNTFPPWDLRLNNNGQTACLGFLEDSHLKGKNKVISHCKYFSSKYSSQINEMKTFIIYQALCRENEMLPLLVMERINYINNSFDFGKQPLNACVAFSKCIPEKCKSCIKRNNILKIKTLLQKSFFTKNFSLNFESRLNAETFEMNCKYSSTPIKEKANAEHSKPKCNLNLSFGEEDSPVLERGTFNEDTTFASPSLHCSLLQNQSTRKFIYDTLSSSSSVEVDTEMDSDSEIEYLSNGNVTFKTSEFCIGNSNSESKINRIQATTFGSTILPDFPAGNQSGHRFLSDTLSSSNSGEFLNQNIDANNVSISSEASEFYNENFNLEFEMNSIQVPASSSIILPNVSPENQTGRRFIYDTLSTSNSDERADFETTDSSSDSSSSNLKNTSKFFNGSASSESSSSSTCEFDQAATSNSVEVESDSSLSDSDLINIFDCGFRKVSNSYSESLDDRLHRYFDGLTVERKNFLSNYDDSFSLGSGIEDGAFIAVCKHGQFEDESKDVTDEPKRVSKVTFAPDDRLVTIHTFEREPEELLPDPYILDRARFQMRIHSFGLLMERFLTAEHQDKIMGRIFENQN